VSEISDILSEDARVY